MSIFCMNCGNELPDDANFCLKCGKQVGGAVKSTPQLEPKWEYCEIVYTYEPDVIKNNNRKLSERMLGGQYYNIVIFAKGVSPQGTFDVPEGNEFKGRTIYSTDRNFLDHPIDLADFSGRAYPLSDNSQDSAAVKNFVGYLTQQGWELLPSRGEYWYSYKFRRKVSSSSSFPPIEKVKTKTSHQWLSEGDTLYNLQRYEEALAAYDQALRLDPNDTRARFGKGIVLGNLKQSK